MFRRNWTQQVQTQQGGAGRWPHIREEALIENLGWRNTWKYRNQTAVYLWYSAIPVINRLNVRFAYRKKEFRKVHKILYLTTCCRQNNLYIINLRNRLRRLEWKMEKRLMTQCARCVRAAPMWERPSAVRSAPGHPLQSYHIIASRIDTFAVNKLI